MAEILCAARDASSAAADEGLAAVAADITAKIRADYHATLDVAFALLPAGRPPRRRHRGGWNHAQRKAFNLATRLRGGEAQALRLLDDTRVPFTNNNAERSLRMVKIHDKISGTFQSPEGAAHFVTIRSTSKPPTRIATTSSTPAGNSSPPAPGSHHHPLPSPDPQHPGQPRV